LAAHAPASGSVRRPAVRLGEPRSLLNGFGCASTLRLRATLSTNGIRFRFVASLDLGQMIRAGRWQHRLGFCGLVARTGLHSERHMTVATACHACVRPRHSAQLDDRCSTAARTTCMPLEPLRSNTIRRRGPRLRCVWPHACRHADPADQGRIVLHRMSGGLIWSTGTKSLRHRPVARWVTLVSGSDPDVLLFPAWPSPDIS
jgi:hypothetical protein